MNTNTSLDLTEQAKELRNDAYTRAIALVTDEDNVTTFKVESLNKNATAIRALYRVQVSNVYDTMRDISIVLANVSKRDLEQASIKTIADYAKAIGLPDTLGGSSIANLVAYGRMQADPKAPAALKRMTPSTFASVATLYAKNNTRARLFADAEAGKLDGKSQKALREYRDSVKGKKKKEPRMEVVDKTLYSANTHNYAVKFVFPSTYTKDELMAAIDEQKADTDVVVELPIGFDDNPKAFALIVVNTLNFDSGVIAATPFIASANQSTETDEEPSDDDLRTMPLDEAIDALVSFYDWTEKKARRYMALLELEQDEDEEGG